MRNEEFRKIRIETALIEKEIKALTADLERVENTYIRVKHPSKSVGVHFAVDVGVLPLQTFILIISLTANLFTIADILHEHLGKSVEKGKSVNFRFDEKEISIKGKWKKQEIRSILKGFSEILKSEERIKEIEVLTKERKTALKEELDKVNEILPTYEELVKIGEQEKERRPDWQKKYEEYFKKLQELKMRKAILEELLED